MNPKHHPEGWQTAASQAAEEAAEEAVEEAAEEHTLLCEICPKDNPSRATGLLIIGGDEWYYACPSHQTRPVRHTDSTLLNSKPPTPKHQTPKHQTPKHQTPRPSPRDARSAPAGAQGGGAAAPRRESVGRRFWDWYREWMFWAWGWREAQPVRFWLWNLSLVGAGWGLGVVVGWIV